MPLNKRFRRVAAFALAVAVMFTTSTLVGYAEMASAQTPPATFYGKGLRAGDRVEAFISNRSCGSTTVNAAGEWSISVPTTAGCQPTAGATVTFTLNGAAVTVTPAATWQGGGLPPDVANGYVLTATGAPTATATGTAGPTVTAPKTGSAGLLGGEPAAAGAWLTAAALLLSAGTVLGARRLATRRSR